MSPQLAPNERIARHPNGHLIVERVPLPTAEDFAPKFASLAKAWPVLATHARHMDGEFDLALTNVKRMVDRLLAAVAWPTPLLPAGTTEFSLPAEPTKDAIREALTSASEEAVHHPEKSEFNECKDPNASAAAEALGQEIVTLLRGHEELREAHTRVAEADADAKIIRAIVALRAPVAEHPE